MLLTDLNGPMSLQPRHTGLGRISHAVRFTSSAILFLSFATLGANVSCAQEQQTTQSQQDQSVAEAARKERARKQEKQKTAKHVYTEEDLKHPNILTPEDRAEIEAKKNECAQKNNCLPAQNPPATLDANSPAPGTSLAPGTSIGPETSLGEVARRLRKQKELEALKPKQTEPFHLPFETPVLASPVLPGLPTIQPSAPPVPRPKISSPKLSAPRIPSTKSFSPKAPANIFRRDPFSGMPARPVIRQPEVARPEIARPRMNGDVHPKLPANIHPQVSGGVAPKISGEARKVGNDLLPAAKSVQPAAPVSPIRPSAPVIVAAPTQPTAAQHTVDVRRGDSLWKLAQQNLGRGNRWPELIAVNPGIVDPNQIRAGTQIHLPVVAAKVARRATSDSPATIKVRKGDTLWTLAKLTLGHSAAWPCLATANPSIGNPNRIYENQELVIPAGCTEEKKFRTGF